MHERRAGESGKRSRGHAELDRHTANTDEPQENEVDSFLANLSKGFEPGEEQGERGEGSDDNSEQ